MRIAVLVAKLPWRAVALCCATLLALAAVGWWQLPEPPGGIADVPWSRRVYDQGGAILRLTLTPDEKYRIPAKLEEISPDLIAATLLQEDRRFWEHHGVDFAAVGRAMLTRRGGASTITMQLARIRYGLHTRTVSGKLRQIYRALQIERHNGKREILEAYLNLAPYGGNVEGAGAGAFRFFGKAPAALTRGESAALSVIPQNPRKRALRVNAENPALTTATRRALARLQESNPRSADLDGFIPQARRPALTVAPHAVAAVLSTDRVNPEIRLTLNTTFQRLLERRIASFIENRSPSGIRNAAAMLVDTRTMDVLAQVGSADFTSEAIAGQVDGTSSRRSPGSTLKPFIYALAIDRGLIHPLSILADEPRSFGSYSPENYDRDFAGPIRASEALARSRNVPAVALASQLGPDGFYRFLKRADVALPRGAAHYGLSLPLGGGEVSMTELVRLYCALANDGILQPLRRTENDPPRRAERRLFSAESAFLTLNMLGEAARTGQSDGTGGEGIYWKTGTSHGFRDAWCVAIVDSYVLAVWVGNADGAGNPALVGRTCAAPLLFSMIDALAPGRHGFPKRQPPPGANLEQVEFCAVSGQLPTEACAHRVTGWFIPGISPIAKCEIHREVLVDVETGLRVPRDDGTRAVRREVYEFWPSEMQKLFVQAGLARRSPPPYLPDATPDAVDVVSRQGVPPQMISPDAGRTYSVGESASGTSIALQVRTDADVSAVYWFANKAFLGKSPAGQPLFWKAVPGSYDLVALDDYGRSTSRTVTLARAAD